VSREPLGDAFPEIVAIASDGSEDGLLPIFGLNDIKGIADFIVATVGLKRK
jgi:hypothetical protein